MQSPYTKTVSLIILFSLVLNILAVPILPAQALELPTSLQGVSSLFGIGGASCSPGGSVGSTILGLGQKALESLGILGSAPIKDAVTDIKGIPGTSTADLLDLTQGLELAGVSDELISQITNIAGALGTASGVVQSILGIAGSIFGGVSEVPVRDIVVRNATTKTAGNTTELVKKECIYDPMSRAIAAFIIKPLTRAIIGWIQGNGGFVQNLEEELRFQLDARAGQFLNNLTGINLCGNLGPFLKLGIGLRHPSSLGLHDLLSCRLTNIIDSLQGFTQNFNNGGWRTLAEIAFIPQNNPYGQALLVLEAKEEAELSRALKITKGYEVGKGFLGFQVPVPVCEGEDDEGNAFCHIEYEDKTPGGLIAHMLNKSVTTELDELYLADEVDEALLAITSAMIQKLLGFSFGSSGQGLFHQSLGSFAPSVQPGDFSSSSLQGQIAREISRVDTAIDILDGRMKQATQTVFNEFTALKSLEKNLEDCQNDEEADCGSIETTIQDTKQKIADAENNFNSAFETKKNLAILKNRLLGLKESVLTTDSVSTMQFVAQERITITNLVDAFLESAQIAAGGFFLTDDLKTTTLEQLAEARGIATREVSQIDDTTARTAASGKTGLETMLGNLATLKTALLSTIQNIDTAHAGLTATTLENDIRQRAIASIPLISAAQALAVASDAATNQILQAFP